MQAFADTCSTISGALLISHFLLQGDDFEIVKATDQFPMPPSPDQATSPTDITFDITIIDDQIYEERECFTCTFNITSVPGRERLCPSQMTTICIVDPGE